MEEVNKPTQDDFCAGPHDIILAQLAFRHELLPNSTIARLVGPHDGIIDMHKLAMEAMDPGRATLGNHNFVINNHINVKAWHPAKVMVVTNRTGQKGYKDRESRDLEERLSED